MFWYLYDLMRIKGNYLKNNITQVPNIRIMKNIAVFKTNVRFKQEANLIGKMLKIMFKTIDVNFDLEDRDHILRVETVDVNEIQISQTMRELGYNCIAL